MNNNKNKKMLLCLSTQLISEIDHIRSKMQISRTAFIRESVI